MARTPHAEHHFTSGNFVRDMVIGMSDGLTVPFALAAGLSGAVSNTRLIVIGGLAEIAAGSIAMGLGGYLAAQGDSEHYEQERARTNALAWIGRRWSIARDKKQGSPRSTLRRMLTTQAPAFGRCLADREKIKTSSSSGLRSLICGLIPRTAFRRFPTA